MSEILDPFDALKSELASVSVSPDFEKRVTTAIRLESEFKAIEVSPAFAVRVRSAIEEQTARRNWFPLNWRWAVSVGAAAAGLVVVAVMLRSGLEQRPVTSVASSGGASQTPPAAVAIRPPAPTDPSPAASVTTTPARGAHGPRPVAQLAAADPLSEVITDQPAVIRQLWARVSPDAALASEDPAAGVFVTAGEIAIPPIEVNPIVVKNVGDPAAAAPGSSPIIRRATAEQAERSPK